MACEEKYLGKTGKIFMIMKPDNEKYNKVVDLLRKSGPELDGTADIEREVIRRLTVVHPLQSFLSEAVDYLFRWVFIGWIRRSLIAASLALVFVFVYQQAVILKRIDVLSRQTIMINEENKQAQPDDIEKLLTQYRNSPRRYSSKSITISDKQMRELLDSVHEMQSKYRDLENLIEGDPELKKLIEKKLLENSHKKINL
jgi:hypothetical protein